VALLERLGELHNPLYAEAPPVPRAIARAIAGVDETTYKMHDLMALRTGRGRDLTYNPHPKEFEIAPMLIPDVLDIGTADYVPDAPPAFVAWVRTRGGRDDGKWNIGAAGHSEAEALALALARSGGAEDRDLLVLPGGEQP
jgi:hypothetical protein